jgi:hypothetical protein
VRICVAVVAVIGCLAGCRGERTPSGTQSSPATVSPGGSSAEGAITEGGSDPWATPAVDPGRCQRQPFAESTPLPEASGAAWLTIDGKLSMVLVADSGRDGAYAIIDPETGATGEQGKLPLGGPGDDIEGLSAHDDKLFGLTSDGWMRVWRRTGKGFELVEGPYAIGKEAEGTTCAAKKKCAINYEGLALADKPQHGCAGFACSKGDGGVYCLAEQGGRYVVDKSRRIAVTKSGALGDCTFDDQDLLWVGDNVFGVAQVFRVDGWADPASAKVIATNAFGVGNPEVIAVRGGVIYRLSDSGGSPSLMGKFRCLPIAR